MSTSLSTRIRPLEDRGTHGWWIQIVTPSSGQLNPTPEEPECQLDTEPAEIIDAISFSDMSAMLVTLAVGTVAISLIAFGLLNVGFMVINYGLVDLLQPFGGAP